MAKKKNAWIRGRRYGCPYDYYEPYEGEWPRWAKNAFKLLED